MDSPPPYYVGRFVVFLLQGTGKKSSLTEILDSAAEVNCVLQFWPLALIQADFLNCATGDVPLSSSGVGCFIAFQDWKWLFLM